MLSEEFPMPARPAALADAAVAAWAEPVTMPSYLPEAPSRYPAYLDRRVYQGSSGRVYPLPFHDRISETAEPHQWQGLHLENAYLRILVLPELGGRIQLALDKRTGYPMFYANPVIKPALVGLAGPWLAGGVELNWPQHHRPATFLPTAWSIEHGHGVDPDGVERDEATLWCSDHDPFARMKGMHGVRLAADSTLVELRVRLFNRSDEPQTFLWWANVAAEVHADYQSFFPADVTMVADHAKRAVSTFPAASGTYYGIDYPARRGLDTQPGSSRRVPGDRLDWPRNIPVPTSYMCLDSTGNFFGGYDHRAGAGFVHWADHHIAVGKKQWTWGDEAFGRAWNANLADDDAAYVELMAGVYTDNQPDFSHLAPGETKVFSQHWYPLAGTGVAVAAGLDAALGVTVADGVTTLRWDVTSRLDDAEITVRDAAGTVLTSLGTTLTPEEPRQHEVATAGPLLVDLTRRGRTLLTWSTPGPELGGEPRSSTRPAVEPPPPAEVGSVEQLYLTGRHLQQYRHATRSPEPYWREALRRDPEHAATHVALGGRRYHQGRYREAERHLRAAVGRLTALNPNPAEGDAQYLLGLALQRLGCDDEAYAVLARAAWVRAWIAPASHQLAVIDARAGRDEEALRRADAALRAEPEQGQVADLRVVLLRRLGRTDEAEHQLEATLERDPLDVWALHLAGRLDGAQGQLEAQTLLDVAGEYARIGAVDDAVALLEVAQREDADRPLGQTACGPLADYRIGALEDHRGRSTAAAAARARARAGDRTWCFPGRLDDVDALAQAATADRDDPTAAALLGHWCYAQGRSDDAIGWWRRSLATDPSDPVVWRNLAVALVNHHDDVDAAQEAYDRALTLAPGDARLWFESDQLAKRTGTAVADRLARLAPAPITDRDDLTVEYAHLLVSADRPDEAVTVLRHRRFQPWEGGEGQVLRAWERAQLALSARNLSADPPTAREHAWSAWDTPSELGEQRHPLANPAQLLLALGMAAHACGDDAAARDCWRRGADAVGDFAAMAPHPYSANTYYSVLAARALGDTAEADQLVAGLTAHVDQLAGSEARVDYFATSLPNLLLFDEDLQARQDLSVTLLQAQLALLADDHPTARSHLARVLAADPGDDLALDLAQRLEQTASLA